MPQFSADHKSPKIFPGVGEMKFNQGGDVLFIRAAKRKHIKEQQKPNINNR